MAKPELPRGYLGPQPKFSAFGLRTLSHDNPEIEMDKNEIEIQFKMGQLVKVTGNLIQVSPQKELGDLIFSQTSGDVLSFIVQVPDPGYYKLQIYALPATDESKTLPGVFNYLLHCRAAPGATRPFPKQYAQWKEGCYLHQPLLVSKRDLAGGLNFKAMIPNAKAVAVVINDEWTQLERKGDNLWEGRVSGNADKMTLNANFGGEELKYSTLLEYTL